MSKNYERALDLENRAIRHIASLDAMTAAQVAIANYGVASRSAIVCTQRLLARMRAQGLVARAIAGDGIYRHFLTQGGCMRAEEFYDAQFSPGYDRSYLNSARYDIVIETALARAQATDGGSVFGRGLIRSTALRDTHRNVDAIVVRETAGAITPVVIIAKVSSVAPSAIERIRELRRRYTDALLLVGDDRVVASAMRKTDARF
jgi:hypothetical protein